MENYNLPEDLSALFKDCRGEQEIREKCLKILTENPAFLKVRVLLSKLYFDQGYFEFATNELKILLSYGKFPLAERILKGLGSSPLSASSTKKIIAEIEI